MSSCKYFDTNKKGKSKKLSEIEKDKLECITVCGGRR